MKWLNWLWLVLIPAAALAVVLFLIAPEKEAAWTTDSPEALDAFERCLEASMKIYTAEADHFCAEALEKDPDFVMPKLQRARFLRMAGDTEGAEELFHQIETADLSKLNPRERFLVRYALAAHDSREEEAKRLLDDYLRKNPDDPFAINIRCNQLWNAEDPEIAEGCYERLLKADPNWVDAQNRLGYLAMARGRFDQAEERFETYGYLAPDQANPHDSMGELLILIGRYPEAEKELRRALSIRADFCASYHHLVRLYLMEGDYERARGAVAELEEVPACDQYRPAPSLLLCIVNARQMESEERWEDLWALTGGPCRRASGEMELLAHEAALHTGRREEALEIEHAHEKGLEEAEDYPEVAKWVGQVLLDLMQATRLRLDGEPAQAAEKLEEANRLIPNWQSEGLSIRFKLSIQLKLAETLAEAGELEKARKVLDGVRAVNPRIAEHYEGPALEPDAG
jgi:tetratricopeptide (TPR) repeat protein